MAALVKFGRVAVKLTNKSSLGAVVSVRHHWNKDFKPALYPETQKEREASAKKYGIPIEQYEVYPNDGEGYGDYPKLKDESVDQRDPYYTWDYPEHRRNFQDVIHAEIDLYSEDRLSTSKKNTLMTSLTTFTTSLTSRQDPLLDADDVRILPGPHDVLVLALLLARRHENVPTRSAEAISSGREASLHIRDEISPCRVM